jgi:hypothetical protein
MIFTGFVGHAPWPSATSDDIDNNAQASAAATRDLIETSGVISGPM